MAKQDKTILGCCKVEAVISVDERGQMVLPKEIREKAQIKAGDKLAVVTGEQNGKISCIALIKAEELDQTVKSILGILNRQESK
ncbi:MAG: Transcriptional regulator, AbrB family [Candidatus Woesebacteria bacterium GW2011_GWD2_40_19]|nr:MAG: Transcriptional regulator, AbrB family [Candidatus Woesebacteria bacterium GW2011_GWD2_40_19]HCC09143.1 AbrB family transcriptional regulator [Candidatus Woesebacteria bacterium]